MEGWFTAGLVLPKYFDYRGPLLNRRERFVHFQEASFNQVDTQSISSAAYITILLVRRKDVTSM
jgi:hypothetical protein